MTTQKQKFDMDSAIKALRAGKNLTGKDGVLSMAFYFGPPFGH